jgi:hypothetical protein
MSVASDTGWRRPEAPVHRPALLHVLLLLTTFAGGARGEPGKVVTLFEYYPARQAAFGAEVPEWGWINLMLPPRNLSSLCQYPPIALQVNNTKKDLPQNRVNVNLGILVRPGNCSAEDQARNAARLRYEGGVDLLRYLVIEGDPNDGNLLGVLFPESNVTNEFSTLVVLSTTYRAGEYLRDDIKAYEQDSDKPIKSPYLYDEASVDWDMVGNIDPYRLLVPDPALHPINCVAVPAGGIPVVGGGRALPSPAERGGSHHRHPIRPVRLDAAVRQCVGTARFLCRDDSLPHPTRLLAHLRPAPHWLSSGMIPGGRPSEPPTDVLSVRSIIANGDTGNVRHGLRAFAVFLIHSFALAVLRRRRNLQPYPRSSSSLATTQMRMRTKSTLRRRKLPPNNQPRVGWLRSSQLPPRWATLSLRRHWPLHS